jgi:molecular chaperone GrpE
MTEKLQPNGETAPERAEEETLAALAQEKTELMDRLMRVTAEFENYRKRIAREQAEWRDRAVEGLVLDLLPVLDSFDRALAAEESAADPDALRHGMELVRKQLSDALTARGVKPIEAVGEPFDPALHEAFLSRPVDEGEEPGTLVEEVVKGYRLGERTIRPTRGIVAVAEEAGPDPDPDPETAEAGREPDPGEE